VHNLVKTLLICHLSSMSFFSHAIMAAEQVDIVFMNGQIETLNTKQPKANAVAIKDEKFIAIGSNQKIKGYIGANTKVVDLDQKLVVPGFVDAHTHPMETIWLKEAWVDARYPGTPSVKQALLNIATRVKATPRDQWIYVAGVSPRLN
jgi:predicted amidohydrolase YtcJ